MHVSKDEITLETFTKIFLNHNVFINVAKKTLYKLVKSQIMKHVTKITFSVSNLYCIFYI